MCDETVSNEQFTQLKEIIASSPHVDTQGKQMSVLILKPLFKSKAKRLRITK